MGMGGMGMGIGIGMEGALAWKGCWHGRGTGMEGWGEH